MQDLPTWGSSEKSFIVANFDTLPRIENFFFAHGIIGVKIPLCLLHVQKISSPKDPQKNNIINLTTCVVVKKVSQLPPMLVDFKYLFLNTFPGLETLYTCYQHKDDLVPKTLC